MNKEALEVSADLAALLEEDEAAFERRAVEQIKGFFEWKKVEATVKKELAKLDPSASEYPRMGPLRRWLVDHQAAIPVEGVLAELMDGEAQLVARLMDAGSSAGYDTPNAIKSRAPELYRRLEELDCFTVDAARVRDVVKKGLLMGGDIAPFTHKVTRTPHLKVEASAAERS